MSHSDMEFPIRIVVSGGTCSVLYLKNRLSTYDIDFFVPDSEIMRAILNAKDTAPSSIRNTYPRNWINAEMIAYVLNTAGGDTLFENSIKDGVILFSSHTLLVYSADWRYQLVGKIRRGYDHMKDYDEETHHVNDAVDILRELVKRNNGEALRVVDVQQWYEFGCTIRQDEITYFNRKYYEKYASIALQ